MSTVTYNHGEAFNLMTYECQRCKLQETLWNSRDGVTPFGIDCLNCGDHAFHINWQQDVRAPEFAKVLWTEPTQKLVKRVFVDAKPHHKHIIDAAEKYVEKWWDNDAPGITMQKTMFPMDKDAAKQYFIKEWTKSDSPTILSVVEYLRGHVRL